MCLLPQKLLTLFSVLGALMTDESVCIELESILVDTAALVVVEVVAVADDDAIACTDFCSSWDDPVSWTLASFCRLMLFC